MCSNMTITKPQTEMFIWDAESMTPRLAVQMQRDGFDIEWLPKIGAVVVSRTLGGVSNDSISTKLE